MRGQILVDTDVVIYFLNGTEPQASTVEGLLRERRLFLPVIAVFELYAGVTGSTRIAAIDSFVEAATVLEMEKNVARKAAGIYTDLKRKGCLIGNDDLFIAATALVNDMSLYTRNTGHFERIDGLEVWRPC